MRSTFKVLFYVNGSKEKNGIVPIMGQVNPTLRSITNRFRLTVRSAPSNKIERDILTSISMEFLAIRGSDARKMSLWKRWDYRQAEETKIED